MDLSASPLDPPTADAWSVRRFVQLGTEGVLRIPDFQRPFRWGAKDVRDLFDSVLNGYPIGSVLLWHREAPASSVRFGPLVVEAAARPDGLFVVDGQQRLTSLVATLSGGEAVVSSEFELYVDLDDGSVKSRGHRKVVPAHWLPLWLVLDTPTLLQYLRDLDQAGLDPGLSNRATTVATRIAEFKIPVSIVNDYDEGVVREIFERVNTTGKRMKASEVFVALHATVGGRPSDDLRNLSDEISGLGFGTLGRDDVLRCVLAVRGGDVYRRNLRSEFSADEDPAEAYRATFETLRRVVAFLREDAAIPHRRALPYVAVLPVLTRFFALHAKPAAHTRQLLRRWVWRSIAGWPGNRDPKPVRIAARDLDGEDRRSEDDQALWLLSQLGPVPQFAPDLDAVRLNQAAARTNIALLGALGPRCLTSGELVDLSSHLEEADPASAVFSSFLPRPRRAAEKDSAGAAYANLSSRLLHPLAAGASPRDEGDGGDDAFIAALLAASPEVLTSHGFDAAASAAIEQEDLETAAEARGRALTVTLFETWERLAEPAATDRPALASMVVDD